MHYLKLNVSETYSKLKKSSELTSIYFHTAKTDNVFYPEFNLDSSTNFVTGKICLGSERAIHPITCWFSSVYNDFKIVYIDPRMHWNIHRI